MFTHFGMVMHTRSQDREERGPPVFPVVTLVQSVGNRPYELSTRTVHATPVAILTFPRGLTLMVPAHALDHLNQLGSARLDVHRKFLPNFGKYQVFTFMQSGNRIKAQIVLTTRLAAACQVVREGGSACFLGNPLRAFRRSRSIGLRSCVSSR